MNNTEAQQSVKLIVFAHSIMKQLPTLEREVSQRMNTVYDNHYTNYFFRNGSAIKLCVPDTELLRDFATQMGIYDIVWFGHNSDPVELVPLHDVKRLMEDTAS
jgi:hypothetical protein